MTAEDRIKAEARAWLIKLAEDAASDADHAACDAWRRADPRHDAAFQRYEEIWFDAAELEELEPLIAADHALLTAQDAAPRRRNLFAPIAGAAAALAAAALAVVVVPDLVAPADTLHDYAKSAATRIAEIRDITLPDGSVVTVGARSQVEVAYSETERRVVLVSGEAFFDVAPDKTWPFVVDAGTTDVQVVGTKFEMRRGAEDVRVAVLEGVVKVNHRPSFAPDRASEGRPSPDLSAGALAKEEADPEQRILTAGESIVAAIGETIAEPAPVGPAEAGAWREGRLVYVDAPLAEVIADANRYTRRRIEIDGDLGDMLVSASFRTDAIDELVETLAASLDVDADRTARDRIVFRPREGGESAG